MHEIWYAYVKLKITFCFVSFYFRPRNRPTVEIHKPTIGHSSSDQFGLHSRLRAHLKDELLHTVTERVFQISIKIFFSIFAVFPFFELRM